MASTIDERLTSLGEELARGRIRMADLQAEHARLTEACLRIEGACLVLKEMQAAALEEAESLCQTPA
jgi:hypothetical protein